MTHITYINNDFIEWSPIIQKVSSNGCDVFFRGIIKGKGEACIHMALKSQKIIIHKEKSGV